MCTVASGVVALALFSFSLFSAACGAGKRPTTNIRPQKWFLFFIYIVEWNLEWENGSLCPELTSLSVWFFVSLLVANSEMQSNKRQRVDSGNSGRKSFGDNQRKKQYSIVDTKWQPCATAFQSDEANVQLDFNYWMTHRQISDEDIVSFLLSVICNDWSQKHFLVPPANLKHILLVGIHNISPIVLSESIDTLPFLRSCSSVPIHHTLTPDAEDRNNMCMDDVTWKYFDTAPMDSMLFWTSIYPLSSSLTEGKDPLDLFRSFRLTFQVRIDIAFQCNILW